MSLDFKHPHRAPSENLIPIELKCPVLSGPKIKTLCYICRNNNKINTVNNLI